MKRFRITIAALLLASTAMIAAPQPVAYAGAAGGIAIPGPVNSPADVVADWIKRGLRHLASVLTNAGRAIVTNRIHGAGTEPLQVGWGTGVGTAAAADTTLFTEKALDLSATSGSRTAGTGSQVTTSVTNDTYQVQATLTATGAGTVTNAGCFDNATIGSGNLYLKGDFTGIGLSSGDSIAFTFKHQLS